jgi:hypothetical protein
VVEAPNIGGLTAANNAAGAAAKTDTPTGSIPKERPSIIIVEVLGYGGGDEKETEPRQQEEQRRKRSDNQSQDPRSRYQILGVGVLTEEQAMRLADEKRAQLGR